MILQYKTSLQLHIAVFDIYNDFIEHHCIDHCIATGLIANTELNHLSWLYVEVMVGVVQYNRSIICNTTVICSYNPIYIYIYIPIMLLQLFHGHLTQDCNDVLTYWH